MYSVSDEAFTRVLPCSCQITCASDLSECHRACVMLNRAALCVLNGAILANDRMDHRQVRTSSHSVLWGAPGGPSSVWLARQRSINP